MGQTKCGPARKYKKHHFLKVPSESQLKFEAAVKEWGKQTMARPNWIIEHKNRGLATLT